MKEEFKSEYEFNNRLHLYFGNRLSLIMLPPDCYGYMYELYDLEKEEIVGRYDSIIDAINKVKKIIK